MTRLRDQGSTSLQEAALHIAGNRQCGHDREVDADFADRIPNESMLAALSVAIGARLVPTISAREEGLLGDEPHVPNELVVATEARIELGGDPLGEAFCGMRPAVRRRKCGAVYTPRAIVKAMLSWAETLDEPDRVIDPGAGSGRFLVEAGAALSARVASGRGKRPARGVDGACESCGVRNGAPVRSAC